MKRLFLLSLGILPLFLLLGCKDDPVSTIIDPPPRYNSFTLQSTHTVVRGFAGDERSETITVTVRDVNNVAVAGVSVEFSIVDPEPYKGSITQEDSLTDEVGVITAVYTVELSDQNRAPDHVVTLEAECGHVTQTIDLDVSTLDAGFPPISIESPPVIIAPPGEIRTIDVTASLLDSSGVGIPDILLSFDVDNSTLGFFSKDTMQTNLYGQATNQFTTIRNCYGLVKITVSNGDTEGIRYIDIQPR